MAVAIAQVHVDVQVSAVPVRVDQSGSGVLVDLQFEHPRKPACDELPRWPRSVTGRRSTNSGVSPGRTGAKDQRDEAGSHDPQREVVVIGEAECEAAEQERRTDAAHDLESHRLAAPGDPESPEPAEHLLVARAVTGGVPGFEPLTSSLRTPRPLVWAGLRASDILLDPARNRGRSGTSGCRDRPGAG